jgi:hypothetical protein
MPRQPTTRPANTGRASTTTSRKPNGNGNGRRNNRAAYWPMELSLSAGIEVVVEGQNGDSIGIAVCSLCAAILPGSEIYQRLHNVWHETISEIAGR